MRGKQLGFVKHWRILRGDSANFHECQRIFYALRHFQVTLLAGAGVDKVQVPAVHLVQVGKSSLCKGAQQVECRSTLIVGLQHSLRVRHPGSRVGRGCVDDVTTVTRQCYAVDFLEIG